MSSRKYQLKPLLDVLRMGLVLVGVFPLALVLLVLGIGVYLWLEEPQRVAVQYSPGTKTVKMIDPQPLQVTPAQTNVLIIELPVAADASGAAAIWVNGKPFQSGGRAAWELVRSAWPLWFACAGLWTCCHLLKRYGCGLNVKSESRSSIPKPGAAPNGRPAMPVGTSGVTEGPPSVN
jgi:hypothetical protein